MRTRGQAIGYEFLLITAEKLTEGPAGELFSRRRADTLAGMRLLPQLSACRYQRHPATLASISSWKRFSTTVVRGPAAADATLAFSRPCADSWRDSAQGGSDGGSQVGVNPLRACRHAPALLRNYVGSSLCGSLR